MSGRPLSYEAIFVDFRLFVVCMALGLGLFAAVPLGLGMLILWRDVTDADRTIIGLAYLFGIIGAFVGATGAVRLHRWEVDGDSIRVCERSNQLPWLWPRRSADVAFADIASIGFTTKGAEHVVSMRLADGRRFRMAERRVSNHDGDVLAYEMLDEGSLEAFALRLKAHLTARQASPLLVRFERGFFATVGGLALLSAALAASTAFLLYLTIAGIERLAAMSRIEYEDVRDAVVMIGLFSIPPLWLLRFLLRSLHRRRAVEREEAKPIG